MCECKAILDKNDKRADLWREILQSEKLEIPLKHPLRERTHNGIFLEGDPSRLNWDQKSRLIKELSKKFNLDSDLIVKDLDNGIMPIKDENISIIICRSHVLAIM